MKDASACRAFSAPVVLGRFFVLEKDNDSLSLLNNGLDSPNPVIASASRYTGNMRMREAIQSVFSSSAASHLYRTGDGEGACTEYEVRTLCLFSMDKIAGLDCFAHTYCPLTDQRSQ